LAFGGEGVISVEKGSVIIRYKLVELIQKGWRGTPLSRSHISSMTTVGSRTLLSRRRVSSTTGGYTSPIYYRGAVSVEKGSVIIRYKLADLNKKKFFVKGHRSLAAMIQA